MLPVLRASVSLWLLSAGLALAAGPPPEAESPLARLQAAFARAAAPGPDIDRYRDLFSTVLQRVQRHYAREVDLPTLADIALRTLDALPPAQGEPAEVFSQAVNAALRTLDGYSRYIDPRRQAEERAASAGSFAGVGVQLEAGEGAVRIVAPLPGSPAARAGLQAGDLIVRVDDKPLLGLPLSDAVSHMRGQPGTPVTLTVRRHGDGQEITVSLTREYVRRQAVSWQVQDQVLVLRMATFSAPVSEALVRAIGAGAAAALPKGIVLDLRGNPGGLLNEAVKTADLFLSGGEIVSLRGRGERVLRSWQADAEELLPGVPIVVLLDHRSASASELVAAALQENGRAVVMGQRSHGKGTVQSTWSLGERGALKLTTSQYVGPSGRAVQGAGVPPDVELLAANAAPRDPPPAGLPAPRARVEPHRCEAVRRAADPALSCALAYLASGGLDGFIAATGGGRH